MRGAMISQKLEIPKNITGKVKDALHSPIGTLVQIELLAFSAAFLLIFLAVVGAYRRRCNNDTFRLILWIAYTTPPTLIHYATGLINGAQSNVYYAIWMIFLMILAVRADSFSAYDLGDVEAWQRYNWDLLLTIAIGFALLVAMCFDVAPMRLAIVFLYFAVVMKYIELAQASMLASKAVLTKNAKLVADYMEKTHPENSQHGVDLGRMEGYSYLVRGEEEEEEQYGTLKQRLFMKSCFGRKKLVKADAPEYHVPMKKSSAPITIKDVWQCKGQLLSARDTDHRIKDFCLSFALFKILSLQFVDYPMPEQVYQKSWELFQKIIHLKDGYERAFRIIEVELTFVFCHFYTKYPYILQPRHWKLKFGELLLVSICSCIVASNLNQESIQNLDPEQKPIIAVTITLIIVVLILEILQLFFMLFSEWGKVVLICNYVRTESWWKNKYIEKLIEFICQTEVLKPWERKLHQYSLLESYNYSPSLLLYNNLTAMITTQKKEGRKQSTPMELSREVKYAVISSLLKKGTKLENGKIFLKNGKTSLAQNNVRTCFWACDLETQAQVIMVWHIATSICEHEIPANGESQLDMLEKFKIATSLSRYLAYLVAFAPRLLPDHYYVTEYVFDQVIAEARDSFKNCNSLDDVIKELLKDAHHSEQGKTVIDRGARLGKKLLDAKEPRKVWEVLADFWAELLLYVAPSESSEDHLEKLTVGGEFVTHIWVLLSHSGIERDPPCKTPKLERSRSCPKA